ncbi:MAG: FAD-binding protein, partial [Clostridia bacterium]
MSILRLENIKIRKDISDSEVLTIACNIFNISEKYVIDYKIVKKSIDARDKNDIFYNYSIIVTLKDDFNIFKLVKNKNVVLLEKANQVAEKVKVLRTSSKKPVIIGAGPAGLFCALTLVENGIKPIIVEQGKKVEERKKDVDTFLESGQLNTLSNVQFGEGGAGTFSDGKLTTSLHSPLCRIVIDTFVKFGAPEQISYINK